MYFSSPKSIAFFTGFSVVMYFDDSDIVELKHILASIGSQ